jgi:sulfur carrier protein ThiS
MQVQVRLFSRLREYLPREARGEATVQVPEAATVADLLAHLGIAERVKLISINGQRETDPGRTLQNGDQVRIFPIVVGG